MEILSSSSATLVVLVAEQAKEADRYANWQQQGSLPCAANSSSVPSASFRTHWGLVGLSVHVGNSLHDYVFSRNGHGSAN